MWKLIKRIRNSSKQKQISGNDSTNLQANQIVINQGITYADAKDIALEVYKTNAIQFKAEAIETVRVRVEEITEKILTQIIERKPESFSELKNPAFQDAMFTVQKQFAKTGEEDLGALLVDILVDRAAHPERTMLQIVLDEALDIAPKLTLEQADSITLNFLLVRTRRLNLTSFDDFKQYFIDFIVPFIEKLTSERTAYSHIEYLGCGHTRAGDYGSLEVVIKDIYKVFLSRGFTEEEFISAQIGDIESFKWALMECMHDTQKLQFNFYDENTLIDQCSRNNVPTEIVERIKPLIDNTTKTPDEVKSIVLSFHPSLQKLFDIWNGSPIKSLELTGVGIAIAHANYRRKKSDTMDLSIWIK